MLIIPKKMKKRITDEMIMPVTVANKYFKKLFMVYDFIYYWTKINLIFLKAVYETFSFI
jgi:hypothetical protein